jgi:hypothetical protein
LGGLAALQCIHEATAIIQVAASAFAFGRAHAQASSPPVEQKTTCR